MRKVCLLGASGSIGTQTLDVIKKNPSDFELVAFSVGRQTRKIRKIVKDFPSVKYICVKKYQQKKYYALASKIEVCGSVRKSLETTASSV